MKKTVLRRVFAFVSALIIGGIALIGTPVTAKAELTDEEIARNKVYREKLADLNPETSTFGFPDIFGMDVMLVTTSGDNPTTTLIAPDGSPFGWAGPMEYSAATDTIRVVLDYGENILYFYAPAKAVTAGGPYFRYTVATGEYYDFAAGKTITEEEFIAANEVKVPNAVPVKGEYAITEANLNKYLPIANIQKFQVHLMVGGTLTFTGSYKQGEVVNMSHFDMFPEGSTLRAEGVLFADPEYENKTFLGWKEFELVEIGEGAYKPQEIPNAPILTTAQLLDKPISAANRMYIAHYQDAPVIENGTLVSATDSKVVVSDASNVLPEGTSMYTEKVASGATFEAAVAAVASKVENTEKVAVYEINLEAAGTEIHQLKGTVKVTVDVPFAISEGKTIKVYRVEGSDLIPCNTTVVDGKVIFETDHFSTYVFVEEAVTDGSIYYIAQTNGVNPYASGSVDAPVVTVTAPKTGDSNIAFMMAMFAVATAGVVVVRRKAAR